MLFNMRPQIMAVAALALSAMLPGTAGAESEAVRAIEKRLGQYEARFNRQDAEAVSRLFSEEVVYYGPLGQVFEGRDAVEQRYRNSFEAGFSDMEVETLEIEVLGDTAWDIARYTILDPSGKPLAGYHLAILERVDGEWIVQRTLVNAVIPQPPR
ncbi:YybH family protein [Paracoccus rhizosphaerae]|uniref:Nuclear transport factor 2 family protein n=1 Tax=Paracoccus rhizosphaerae TaxID=1133347 RepID=A0ABV6CQU0_9RHOB|nr:nuclear transport factor 2 family protein [Paracoccus rhizosphaerae]